MGHELHSNKAIHLLIRTMFVVCLVGAQEKRRFVSFLQYNLKTNVIWGIDHKFNNFCILFKQMLQTMPRLD